MTPLETEQLFIAIGLMPILEGKPTLHLYQRTRARNFREDVRERIARFLATDEVEPAKEVPAFDYQEALKLLPAGLTEPASRALFDLLGDDDVAQDLGLEAQRMVTWGNGILPREARALPGNQVRVGEPGPNAAAEFRRQWNVAVDPDIVLGDLEDGSLSDDQVQAIMLLYPETYKEIRQAVSDEMAAMTGRKGTGWEPPPIKQHLIATLLQESQVDPALTATMQALYAQDPQAQPPPPSKRRAGPSGDAAQGMTPGQRAAGGVNAG